MAINKNGTNTDKVYNFKEKWANAVVQEAKKTLSDYPSTSDELKVFEEQGSIPGQEWRKHYVKADTLILSQ